MARRVSNGVLAGGMAVVVAGMVGVAFASVPLYRLFCQATGYAGTPQIGGPDAPGQEAGQGPAQGTMEIRFDANTSPTLPWRFTADRRSVTVALGEQELASYTGRNEAGRAVTGVATYNVQPDKAARYFHKTACFCFDEQTLQPNQQVSFPLSFWVDPAIRTDPETRDVKTITLSYTFFRSLDDAARNGGLDKAGPHVGPLVPATGAPPPGPRAEAAPSGLNPAPISR